MVAKIAASKVPALPPKPAVKPAATPAPKAVPKADSVTISPQAKALAAQEDAKAKAAAAQAKKDADAAKKLQAAQTKAAAAQAKKDADAAKKLLAAQTKAAAAQAKKDADAAKKAAIAAKSNSSPKNVDKNPKPEPKPEPKKEGDSVHPEPKPEPKKDDFVVPPQQDSNAYYVKNGTHVIVDIKNSDSGYNNQIYWSDDNFRTKHYLGIDNNTGTFDLGTFHPGTRIDFGIDNGQGNFFRTGGTSQNADGREHVQKTEGEESVQYGFEDLWGGGDNDFNDAIITVRQEHGGYDHGDGTEKTNDNRSGLGDGTNPGQGGGTVNSPNEGTLNPNQSPAPAADAANNLDVQGLPQDDETEETHDNRSGLGDGTNPGQGAGRDNSPNEGTLNPHQSDQLGSNFNAIA